MTKRLVQFSRFRPAMSWLDVLAITLWGVFLLDYWLTGKLGLLIHPRYYSLSVVAGFSLLSVGGLKAFKLLRPTPSSNVRHLTLFPPGWMSGLFLAAALVGLLITPQPFMSQTAIRQGVSDSLALTTRAKPQTFRGSIQPEARSLIDWVRTLEIYPEPDAYVGQRVKVQGFVIYPPELPEQYFTLSRFVITCCAADAYPVGLPVKLTQSRRAYAPDTWLEIEGQMITETLAGKRQLIIQAKSLKPITEPKNPYAY